VGCKAGEDKVGGDRHHLQLLGRLGSSAAGPHAQGQQHPSVLAALSRADAPRIQRTETGVGRPADVRQRGSDHSSPLDVLRLHRNEGAGQERSAVQLRRPRRCAHGQRRQRREG